MFNISVLNIIIVERCSTMNKIPLITDATNRFYAGMTLNEAKRLGVDKSFWKRDFHNVDKNKDGVLSVDEILKERKHSSNSDKIVAGIFASWWIFDAFTTKSKGWLLAELAFAAFAIYNCLSRALRNDKKTKEIEKIIQEQQINRYA